MTSFERFRRKGENHETMKVSFFNIRSKPMCHDNKTCKGILFHHEIGKEMVLKPEECSFIKKSLQHRCVPENITKFLRTVFLQKISGGCYCTVCLFSSEISFEVIQKEATVFIRITIDLTLHSLKEGDVMVFYKIYNVKVLLSCLYFFHVLEILMIEKYLSSIFIPVKCHSFSTYVTFSEKLTFLPP